MLDGCSEACPAHVALQAVGVGITLFYHAVPLFSAIRKQASFFPNIAARTEQKLAIEHVPRQAKPTSENEQAKALMVGVTLHES